MTDLDRKQKIQEEFTALLNKYGFTNGFFLASDACKESHWQTRKYYMGSTREYTEQLEMAYLNAKMSLGLLNVEPK